MSKPVRIIEAAAIFAIVLTSGVTRAQDRCAPREQAPTPQEVNQARSRFVEGTQAAEEGRWIDALAAFEASYRLSSAAAALHNTARALEELGRYRAARDTYDCLLRSDLDDETRASVRALRDVADQRVARLVVEGLPRDPTLEVEVDGRTVDDGARPLVVAVDPGEHSLRATAERRRAFRWNGALARSARETIEVDMPLDAPVEDEGSSIVEEPAFWIVAGAVVVGAITTGVLLQVGAQLDGRTDVVHTL